MGFTDNIRLSSIFGNGGSPLGGVNVAPAQDLITEYATRMLPIIHGEQNRQLAINTTLANRVRAQKQEDEDNARLHPNVVFNPNGANGISPLQKANIQVKEEAEQGRNDRANASLNEKQQYGQTVNKIRQQATDISNFKATHPNVQITAQKGGNYHIYDPAHPELGMQDTGVDTGTSTDEEKAQLGFDNNLQLIKARGDQSRDLQIMKSSQANEQIGARGDQTRLTNAAKPQNVKPQTAADKKTDYFNKAQKLMNNPIYSKYITNGDKAGEFTIKPETPQNLYHEINSQIYGDSIAQPNQDVELPDDSNKPKDSLNIR